MTTKFESSSYKTSLHQKGIYAKGIDELFDKWQRVIAKNDEYIIDLIVVCFIDK